MAERHALAAVDPFLLGVLAVFCVAITLLLLPLAIVFILSFTSLQTLQFPPPALSLRWYAALLSSPELQRDALISFKVALGTTALSIVLAVPAALALVRRRGTLTVVLDALLMTPVLLPSLAFGLALLMMLSTLHIPLSPLTLVLGHTVVCAPFVLRTVTAAAGRLSPTLSEASLALGASGLYTYRRVTIPLVAPGIGAGAFIAFMLSFDNVPVSLFVSDARTETLPIRLWYLIFHTLDVRTAAVAGSLVSVTFALILIMERLTGVTRYLR